MLELTEDMSVIAALIEHPDIIGSVEKELVTPMEEIGLQNLLEETRKYFYFFLFKEDSIPKGFISFYKGKHTAFAHTGFLKEFRGPKAFEAGKSAIDYMFRNTKYKELGAEIPVSNTSAVKYALQFGFKIESTDNNIVKMILSKDI